MKNRETDDRSLPLPLAPHAPQQKLAIHSKKWCRVYLLKNCFWKIHSLNHIIYFSKICFEHIFTKMPQESFAKKNFANIFSKLKVTLFANSLFLRKHSCSTIFLLMFASFCSTCSQLVSTNFASPPRIFSN